MYNRRGGAQVIKFLNLGWGPNINKTCKKVTPQHIKSTNHPAQMLKKRRELVRK